MKEKHNSKQITNAEVASQILAEYNALRTDVMKRMDVRHQMISLALVISGTLLTFGLQKDSPASVLFIYPLLCVFLTGVWSHNVVFSRKITYYIRDSIESKLEGVKWETISEKERFTWANKIGEYSISGIFITTQIVFIILGLLKTNFPPTDLFLISVDGFAFIITVQQVYFALTHNKPKKAKQKNESR